MSTRAENKLPPALAWFAQLMAAMGALSLGYTLLLTHLLHSTHPYGTTLFWGHFTGSDFSVFAERSRLFGTSAYWDELNYPFTYPAPLGVVFALLFHLPHPLTCYLALCVGGLAVWGWWLSRAMVIRGVPAGASVIFVLIMLATAWPVVNLLNTANTEGLLAILLGAGMLALMHERWWLAATLIGLSTSMKLYPFMLLALLLSRRRYREFTWGVAVAAVTTVVSLALLGPNIFAAQRHVSDGLRFVKTAFILATQRDALNYSHSLFSLLKFAVLLIARLSGTRLTPAQLDPLLRLYMVFAAIAGVALYFLFIRRLPMLNQLLALTICAVVLPPLSADYTLLELLVPFALLCLYAIDSSRNDLRLHGLRACFLCFACIFAWETFLTVHYAFDRPVRSIALVVLLTLVLRFPFVTAALRPQGDLA
jgi:hypothetical protein